MQALGAPNLTDSVWLLRQSSETTVSETIAKGRVQQACPPTTNSSARRRCHLLAAYVYGLGGGEKAAPATPQAATAPAGNK
jgi:cytochrome c oxidase cbb3-type subunit 3